MSDTEGSQEEKGHITPGEEVEEARKTETCSTFGNRCTICGAYFASLQDTVCGSGHIIGAQYFRR